MWQISTRLRKFFRVFERSDFGHQRALSAYYRCPESQVPDLWFIFELFLGRRPSGTFVEIGANDGVRSSNTWGLALKGWEGHLIEPIPVFADECRSNHASHPKVDVHQVAIAGPETTAVELTVAGVLTTANKALLNEYASKSWNSSTITEETVTVECTTLDGFLTARGVKARFEVLSVDVEGFEAEVFRGFDLKWWKPRLMIIELSEIHPDIKSTRRQDAMLSHEIQSAGYVIVYKDSVNTVFVSSDVYAMTMKM